MTCPAWPARAADPHSPSGPPPAEMFTAIMLGPWCRCRRWCHGLGSGSGHKNTEQLANTISSIYRQGRGATQCPLSNSHNGIIIIYWSKIIWRHVTLDMDGGGFQSAHFILGLKYICLIRSFTTTHPHMFGSCFRKTFCYVSFDPRW